MPAHRISLKPSSIVRVLGAIACLLVLAGMGTQLAAYLTKDGSIYGLVPLFNLDEEQNIPTFFSTGLLLCATLLLVIITLLKRNQKAPYVSHWALLSLGFLFMAADEASSIHEHLQRPIRSLLGDGDLGIFRFAWVIPGIALVLILAVFFLRFWLRLPAKTRLGFCIAASIYIGGAVGFELVGGGIFSLYGRNWLYIMSATAEEGLEMTGLITFIWALLVYIAENYQAVQFGFGPVREKSIPSNPEA